MFINKRAKWPRVLFKASHIGILGKVATFSCLSNIPYKKHRNVNMKTAFFLFLMTNLDFNSVSPKNSYCYEKQSILQCNGKECSI